MTTTGSYPVKPTVSLSNQNPEYPAFQPLYSAAESRYHGNQKHIKIEHET
jgi:hypothetical protein